MRTFVRLFIIRCWICGSTFLISHAAFAQVLVKGTVYDMTQKISLATVNVDSRTGVHTVTDSIGNYRIVVPENDSISFSYLGRSSPWFSVKEINYPWAFDVALHVYAPDLPEIFITKQSYREDSLQNRREYEKIFDFRNPHIATSGGSPESGSLGVGLDLESLVNMLRFGYNKRQKGYQQFFEWEEHEKYIDHRFSKPLIKKLTGLSDESLDAFIKQYRPSYEFMENSSEIDLGLYIQRCKGDFDTGHPSSAAAMMSNSKRDNSNQ